MGLVLGLVTGVPVVRLPLPLPLLIFIFALDFLFFLFLFFCLNFFTKIFTSVPVPHPEMTLRPYD